MNETEEIIYLASLGNVHKTSAVHLQFSEDCLFNLESSNLKQSALINTITITSFLRESNDRSYVTWYWVLRFEKKCETQMDECCVWESGVYDLKYRQLCIADKQMIISPSVISQPCFAVRFSHRVMLRLGGS